MIPTLWIHDHIVVKKYSFGMHFPFSDSWLFQWRNPKRGEVIVFKYPKSPDTYYIKRLIGLPGDHIRVNSREVWVNDKKLQRQSLTSDPNDSTDAYLSDGLKFDKFLEKNDESEYVSRHLAYAENDSSS